MRQIRNMCEAGMLLNTLTEQIKEGAVTVTTFDTKTYLVEKLESLFYDIQADISLAVSNALANDVLEIMGEDESDGA